MIINALVNRPDKPTPIGIVKKPAFGLGDFASCTLYVPAQSFLMFYYTDYIHINIGIVATIMLASRIFDGFSDIFMGHLIERTNSPYGKARAWLLRMLIPYILGTVMLFSVPESFGETAKLIYVFFSYNFAITIVYTGINLPYGAMMTMMTKDGYERSVLVIFRMVLATAGAATITAITLPLVKFFGDDVRAWTYAFMVIGVIGAAIFFVTFFFCHERVASPVPEEKDRDFKKNMKQLFTNRYWIALTLAMVFVCCSDIVYNTVNIYVCKYFLNDAELIGPFGLTQQTLRLLSMVVVLPFLLKPFGKRNCLLIACVCIFGALALRLLFPHSVTCFYATAVLYGFGQGFTYTTLFAMIPDTVEYGEYKDGERHEGYIYAGASFGTKVGAGVGPAIVGLVLNFSGYDAEAASLTEEVSSAILMVSSVIPAVILGLAFIAMLFYKLDKEYDGIIKELEIRHQKEQANS